MQRYFVGHRLRGEVEEYYEKITKELSEKFGIMDLGKRVAPHFTLKPPFESPKMDEFEKQLEEIARGAKKVPFQISGFDKFDPNSKGRHTGTIFLAIKENKDLQYSAQKIGDLIAHFGENKNDFPPQIRLHASIARYLDQEMSFRIWEYLQTQPLPQFDGVFDNLTIFQYIPGGWKIHKTFEF